MAYQFPGYPKFIKTAGEGNPPAVVARAQKHPAIGEISRLLSQAAGSDPAYRRDIMRHAADRMAAFRVAMAAAEAMYAEVDAALFPADPNIVGVDPNSNNVGVDPDLDTEPPTHIGRKGRR